MVGLTVEINLSFQIPFLPVGDPNLELSGDGRWEGGGWGAGEECGGHLFCLPRHFLFLLSFLPFLLFYPK